MNFTMSDFMAPCAERDQIVQMLLFVSTVQVGKVVDFYHLFCFAIVAGETVAHEHQPFHFLPVCRAEIVFIGSLCRLHIPGLFRRPSV